MNLKKFAKMHSRKTFLIFFDFFCIAFIDLCYFLVAKFIDHSVVLNPKTFWLNELILACCVMLSRLVGAIYFNIWRYSNTRIYLSMIIADGVGTVFAMVFSRIFGLYESVWPFITVAALVALMTLSTRFCYRLLYKYYNHSESEDSPRIPVAIVGAGQIGALLADELKYSKNSNYKPLFFIDKDASKAGSFVAGLKVYQEGENTLELIRKHGVSEIFIALTGLDSESAQELYHFYSKTSCKIKLYETPVRDLTDGGNTRRSLRNFEIEDLLFRKPIDVNDSRTYDFYRGKTVMVTGGGGSIGSEICRQIAKCEPKQLVILDIYENNAYEIQQELIRQYGDRLNLKVVIASVRDRVRLEAIFREYRPQVVFHAAAHKHVPLMEDNGCEAIKNNVFGTNNTADMAEKYGVEKFILISTDKAVNPTNIMGASKRMCEMIVQSRNDGKTSFSAVRFGNVLGSNGSVIPLFRKQIESGGPVTITDKRIIRYFMTIPEASQLVIRAGAMAKSGELFVLDMGKPVLIYDLAINMIRLSGLTPNVDIKIEEIGLRPGEKLFEELLIKTENLNRTEHKMIFVEKDQPLTRAQVQEKLDLLARAVKETENDAYSPEIKRAMKKVVPTFYDPDDINRNAEKSDEMKLAGVNV